MKILEREKRRKNGNMTEKSKPTLGLHYLQRLAELYPTIAKASTEIINLQSILNLPKGTEHFITNMRRFLMC